MKRLCILFSLFVVGALARAQTNYDAVLPDIALPAASGDTIRLSSLRGKLVLVDFWASWCGPCRVANKGLVKLYEKFHDKGFEIYSVSLDEDRSEWLKAVKKDKIQWLQVIDNKGWEAATARQWNIFALPTSYLIDATGTVIAMDLEGKALEKVLKEMLDK